MVQVSYFLNHAPDDKGLQGQYSFGGFYDSNRFASLNNPNSTKSGLYGIYGMFQQMIYRDGEAGSQKGLTIWGEINNRAEIKCQRHALFRRWRSELSGRHSPAAITISLQSGVIYGTFSRYIPRTSAETVIEANYQVTLNQLALDNSGHPVCHQPQRQQCNQKRVGLGHSGSNCFLEDQIFSWEGAKISPELCRWIFYRS